MQPYVAVHITKMFPTQPYLVDGEPTDIAPIANSESDALLAGWTHQRIIVVRTVAGVRVARCVGGVHKLMEGIASFAVVCVCVCSQC